MDDPVSFAHNLEDRPEREWQPLPRRLRAVGDFAGRFAAAFCAREWGELAGLWHDMGKFSATFQQRLRGGQRVDHSTAGAQQDPQSPPPPRGRG